MLGEKETYKEQSVTSTQHWGLSGYSFGSFQKWEQFQSMGISLPYRSGVLQRVATKHHHVEEGGGDRTGLILWIVSVLAVATSCLNNFDSRIQMKSSFCSTDMVPDIVEYAKCVFWFPYLTINCSSPLCNSKK